MMIFGSIAAIIHGAAQPCMLLVFGVMIDTFILYDIELQEMRDPNKTCTNNTITWINGSIFEKENETLTCG